MMTDRYIQGKDNRRRHPLRLPFVIYHLSLCMALLLCASACSTTKQIPDDDHLYTGLTSTDYECYAPGDHFDETRAEVDAALATAPNGSLFGSSHYRTPFPIGLWIWNWANGSHGVFKRWMNRSFGKEPVLISKVNPALRASVAKSVLRKNGYLHASVSYEEVPQKNPKKMKLHYTVRMDSLFTVDTMSYEHFPPQMQHLIDSTLSEAKIGAGKALSVANLDGERTRLSQLMRNNGYYYFQPGYMSYLADTFGIDNRARLRLQLADSLPPEALKPWTIGKITMQMRRSMREQLTDSVDRSFLKIRYHGKNVPLRPGVVLRNMKLMPRRLFSYDNYQESMQKVSGMGVFSSVDFRFTPSQLPPLNSQLDLTLNCTFDQPYDFYVEGNLKNRTIGRAGPEMKVGLVRRNAFRGGEHIDVNLHGAYEWQTSGGGESANSYQYGADASIEFPRILAPFVNRRPRRTQTGATPLRTDSLTPLQRDSLAATTTRPVRRRRRFFATPWTIAKVSSDIVRRPNYYKMHIVSGEWTYRWQSSENVKHEFSPLTLKYQFMNSRTDKMDSILNMNPYLGNTMMDHFIPKMRYSYSYSKGRRNPLRLNIDVDEAGNIASLYFLAKGEGWNTKEKKMFKNPYSQFVRLEADITKTWTLDMQSQLVGHINTGKLVFYGNSREAPFSELFYAGGANSIRAFPVRSIGPGRFLGFPDDKQFSYVLRNGDLKLVMNLEYRRRLFGNLYGAVFLDVGNVWSSNDWFINDAEDDEELDELDKALVKLWNAFFNHTSFSTGRFFDDLATGTGIGLRYDLDFLVVRVDWGIGLHLPYETGKNGYFNISRFKDMHTLHLAIGYPF